MLYWLTFGMGLLCGSTTDISGNRLLDPWYSGYSPVLGSLRTHAPGCFNTNKLLYNKKHREWLGKNINVNYR